jgi:tRNA (cmo5U34)-methyltransferase
MNIPTNWTFRDGTVAAEFDNHVREQLPWYDLVTRAVAHIGRHYIPEGGVVLDIGASTGNIGRALADTLASRKARLYAVEQSPDMVAKYNAPGEVQCCSATDAALVPCDLCVCFLVVMFLPIVERGAFLKRLYDLISYGGALVVVDKIQAPSGYVGTVMRRLPMEWKMQNGASAEDIIKKELSLAGYQRPIDPAILPGSPVSFFQMGEFAGWIIAKPEVSLKW